MQLESLESAIVFGPFKTEYFRVNSGASLRTWFLERVRDEFLPLLTGPVQSVKGRVFAPFDEPRHVGPHSCVKDRYDFELLFTSPDEIEKVTGSFDSRTRKFRSVRIDNRAERARAHAELRSTADPDITIGDPRFAEWTGPDLANAGAKTLEEGIVFGPFATDHFRTQADARFRSGFLNFVREKILPKVKGESPLVGGEVFAAYDGSNHLGPDSALKFRYTFRIIFSSTQGEERVGGLVDYSSKTGKFTPMKEGLTWTGLEESRAMHLRWIMEERIAYRYRQGQRKIICPACAGHLIDFHREDGMSDMVLVTSQACGGLKFSFSLSEQDQSGPVAKLRLRSF